MHLLLQLLLCLAFVCAQGAVTGPVAVAEARSGNNPSAPAGVLDSVLRGNGKSRQSRCVRCYEDRYYGGSSGSGDRYGGYSSRAGEDPRSAWYYSYDRYEDRGGSGGRDRDYDRYYSRDTDRYSPRTYDRYEGRGYDDYYRRGSYDRGSGAGAGAGYGYSGYDTRDRYYGGDRYSDSSRDRYYDRSRSSYDRYDPYDRYYSRYDFRNYRPWDETYRGQSGFDNSGRGYYFAGDENDNPSQNSYYDRERAQSHSSAPASPCGHQVRDCPYADRGGGGMKVSSSAIGSDGYRGGHTSIMGGDTMGKPNGQGSWTYLGDQDKQSGGSGGSSAGGGPAAAAAGSSSGSGGGNGGGSNRDRERDPQSSSYGGRPRPLGGSYLFDRDSNAVPESPSSNGDSVGDGSSPNMPAAAAQTAPASKESQDNVKDKA